VEHVQSRSFAAAFQQKPREILNAGGRFAASRSVVHPESRREGAILCSVTRAPIRQIAGGTALACCALRLAIGPVSSVRADDDWSLTRPTRGHAGLAPRASAARAEPAQALELALAHPLDGALVAQLFAAYRGRDGDLRQLEPALEARAALGSARPRQVAAALVLLARLQETLGESTRARELFARAVEVAPSAELLRAFAQLEHAAGELARERTLLERALLALAKDNVAQRARSSSELGALTLELGDVAAAREHFAAAARGNPGSLVHALAFARALAARAAHAEAADAFAEAVAKLGGDPRVLPGLLLEFGKLQLAAARWEPALVTLRRARRALGPRSGLYPEALEGELEAHRQLGSLAAFARELEAARDADSELLLARVDEELDQPAAALAALRRVLAQKPGDLASAERVIALLWRDGRVDEVIEEYQRLLRAAPHEPRLAAELCQLLFQTGRRSDALATLDRLARDNPRDVRMHETIAELFARFAEPQAAHRELEVLAKLAPGDPDRLIALAESELAQGRRDGARAALRRVAQASRSFAAHLRLAQIYLDHEFPNEALAEYDTAERLHPQDCQVMRGRAAALARTFRYKDAAAEWQRVLASPSADRQLRRDARRELVALWDELGELRSHVAELEQRCAYTEGSGLARDAVMPPCDADSARMLAEAYERQSRHGGLRAEPLRQLRAAEDVWLLVARIEPHDLDSWLALERLRVKRGDLDAAVVALEQLTRIDPDNQRAYLERMVSYALSRYRDAQAARYAQRAVESAPDDAAAHERLGDLYRAQRDMPRALASYTRALALDPSRYELAFRIAEHELAQGELDAAERRLRTVIGASQDDELVLRALRSLLSLGFSETRLLELERQLLPLALATPPRAVYRRALLELYALLIPELVSRAQASVAAAREALSAIGRRAAKPLLEALVDTDLSQARQAVVLLAEVGNASVARALLAVAESGTDLELRRDALRAAATLAADELTARLCTLAHVREARLATVAVWALARSENAAASAALRELVGSPLPALRGYALLGLARRADVDAYALLQQALARDASPFVRSAAALGLGMLGDPAAGSSLAQLTVQTHAPALAETATLALGLLGGSQFAATLAQSTFASDARVRAAAGLSLAALDHADRALFELPLPQDRLELTSLLDAARTTLSARASADLARYAGELRQAASEALRGDDARKLAVLSFVASDRATLPTAASGDPRELGLELRAALLPELARLRVHPALGLRVALVKAVGATASRDADALLLELAQDREPVVRGLALSALAARPLSNALLWTDRLSSVALSEPAFWLRERAVHVLARLASPAATRVLVRVLSTEPYALVRESAAQSLAGREAGLIGPVLIAALHDPEPRVCAAAARALRVSGGEPLRTARSDATLAPVLRELLSR
jgi:tetratricopeptide (TPR) repeat protein